ncbi:MAG TPA: hypothetical protein VJQ82_17975 [Terriglobales bacterium]|nr:hypothetical protein [Terriglobales bacterium]
MEKKIMRTKGNRWCELQVSLEDGRLSICGSEGSIISRTAGKKQAREYWESFLEDSPEELGRLAVEYGVRTSKSAARLIQRIDGDYHGLDVHQEIDRGLLITESCGQIRESLLEWFPEVGPYLKYHLNDMHAECEHQEQRGETYGNHPGAVCPECGWRLGHGWSKRELPNDVKAWFIAIGTAQGLRGAA